MGWLSYKFDLQSFLSVCLLLSNAVEDFWVELTENCQIMGPYMILKSLSHINFD